MPETYINELCTYARQASKQYPQHAEAIRELVHLVLCEIDAGESEHHEVELAIESIDELCNTA